MSNIAKTQQTDFNFDYGFNQWKPKPPLKKPAKRKEFKQDPLDRICKDVRSQVQAITQKVKEQYDMALPKPAAQKEFDNNPKLEPKHVKKGATVTLDGSGREISSDFGDSLVLDCKVGRTEYTWFIRMDSGNYRKLYKRFGSNIAKWKGKVKVTTDAYAGNSYVKVIEG